MRTAIGTRCVICSLPANDIPYEVHYESGDYPPVRGWFFLCAPHAVVLALSEIRPIVPRKE